MAEQPVIINDPTKELGYFARRSGLFVAGKQMAESFGDSLGAAIEPILTPQVASYLPAAASVIKGTGGLAVIGLAAGVSAGLTQMDYQHRKDSLAEMYKEEISLKLGKKIDGVGRSDLDKLAPTNYVIDEELRRNSKQRTFGVALSFIASMASLAVIRIVLPALLGPTLGIGVEGAQSFMQEAGTFLIRGAAALITYQLVKDPLHAIADKLFDIDKVTVNDGIVSIGNDRKAGKAISREQVLSVFVAAHPQLAQFIVRNFGQHYDNLSLDDKKRATTELNKIIPLDKLTLEINSGKTNVTELAFAVQGEISGVDHERFVPRDKPRGFFGSMFASVGRMLGLTSDATPDHADTSLVARAASMAVKTYEYSNPAPAKPHVQQLGLSKIDAKLTHVEKHDLRSAEVALAHYHP